MEQDKPKRLIKWGNLGIGLGLTGFALAGAGADIQNNFVFAVQKSVSMAVIFVAAGVGLALLPFITDSRWRIQVWVMIVVCGAACAFAGYQNHMASQRNHDLAQKAITEAYDNAQKAIRTAQEAYDAWTAKADAITETMGSVELQKLSDAASKKADIENASGGCGKRCREATDAADAYLKRLGQAKAKEAAQERAKEAWNNMQTEKAKAPAQARAHGESHEAEMILTIILLAASIGGATFLHPGLHYLQHCVEIVPPAKPKKPMTLKKAEAVAVQAVAEKKNDVKAYVQGCLEPSDGKCIPSAKIYDDFCAWWAMHNPGQKVPTTTMFGTAMGKAYSKSKSNGVWQYQAQIKAWRPAKPALEKVA